MTDEPEQEKKSPTTPNTKDIADRLPATTKNVDKAAAAVVDGIFYGLGGGKLQAWSERQRLTTERNQQALRSAFEGLDVDDVVLPPQEIATELLEKLNSTDDEKLADIIIKLLVAASSKKHGHLVHPSMVTVARNLSPDEATILNSFRYPYESIPMIDVRHVDERPEMKNQTDQRLNYFTRFNELAGLANPENVDFYIGNFISLGLFEAQRGFVPTRGPEGNTPDPEYAVLERIAEEQNKPRWQHYAFQSDKFFLKPTDKGCMFIRVLKNVAISGNIVKSEKLTEA